MLHGEKEREREEGGIVLKSLLRRKIKGETRAASEWLGGFFFNETDGFEQMDGGERGECPRGDEVDAPIPSKKGFQSKHGGQKVLSKLWLAGARQPAPTTLERVLDRLGDRGTRIGWKTIVKL